MIHEDYAIVAFATDAAGNIAHQSATFTITIDATAPAVPHEFTLIDNGTATNNPQPTFSLQIEAIEAIEAYATVILYMIVGSTKVTIGVGTAGANGYVSVTSTTLLSDGEYSITAIVIDKAGNIGSESSVFVIILIPLPHQYLALYPLIAVTMADLYQTNNLCCEY